MNAISARVALLNHLEAQNDRAGMRSAYAALDASDYALGIAQESARNWRRSAADALRSRGIVGDGFSVTWNNGELTHSLREAGNGRAP